jgi:2-(3-amino-3-carboxypropyl)histidine synthase
MFDLQIERIAAWVNDRGYASVAIQLPEGLRPQATGIIDSLSGKTRANFIIIGDPCYGACDTFVRFKDVAEALVHFGHSAIPSMGVSEDVLYIEAFYNEDISDKVVAVADRLPQRVGLLATVQYVGCIGCAKAALESTGRTVLVGMGDRRTAYRGQVLGCNCSAAEAVADSVDAFLFLGEGDFHPLAAAFGVKKPILILNPISGELRDVNDVHDRMLRRRFAAIERARDAKSFIVAVSSKPGQKREAAAAMIVHEIEASGRSAYVVYLAELSPQNLVSYRADAIVCTACPRIAMDDASCYDRPFLTITEAEVAIGIRKWEDYSFDAIRPE